MQHPYVPFQPPAKHFELGGANIDIQGMYDETVCFICRNVKSAHSKPVAALTATFGRNPTMKQWEKDDGLEQLLDEIINEDPSSSSNFLARADSIQ